MKISQATFRRIVKEEIDRLVEVPSSDITAPPGDDNTAVDPEWSERQLQAQEDDDIGYLHSVLRGRETRQRANQQFEDWLPPGRFPSAPEIDPETKKRSYHGHRIKPVGKSLRPAEHSYGRGAIAFEYIADEHPEPLVLKLLSNDEEMKVYENLRKVLAQMPKEVQRRFATIYDMGYVWTRIRPDDPDEPRTIKARAYPHAAQVGWILQEKVAPLGESYVQLGQLGKEWYSTFGVGDWPTVLHNITTNEPYARRFLEKWLSARVSYGGKIPQRSSGPKDPEHYTDKEEDQFASAVDNFIGQLKATIPQSMESIRKQMRSYPDEEEVGYIEKVLWPPLLAFSARIPIPKSMKDEILRGDFPERDIEIAYKEMLSAFPVGPKERIKGFTHEKLEELGVGSLLRALELFKEKGGFSWGDLHAANIGIRPGTKELVVLDAGHIKPPKDTHSATGTMKMTERFQRLAGIILK